MKVSEFKTLLGDVAKSHDFIAAYGGWYRDAEAASFVLSLQKSNVGNYFELNLKLFLGCGTPIAAADLKRRVKNLSGDVFRRQPERYRDVFDLDAAIDVVDRRRRLEEMFTDLIDRIASAAASPLGILRLGKEGVVHLLPVVEERLKA